MEAFGCWVLVRVGFHHIEEFVDGGAVTPVGALVEKAKDTLFVDECNGGAVDVLCVDGEGHRLDGPRNFFSVKVADDFC